MIARLRRALAVVPGGRLFLQSIQDIRVGGRQSNAQYQFTLQGDSTAELYAWAPKLTAALQRNPALADVNSDQQQSGLETDLVIDRDTAAKLGVTPSQIDNTLYDAFGQRQVSTIYNALNQYHVVMEVAPRLLAESGLAEGHLHQHHRRHGQRHLHHQCGRRHHQRIQRRGHGGELRQQLGAQCVIERAGQLGQGQRVLRRAGQHQPGNDDPALRHQPLCGGQHAAGGEPPVAVRRHTISFNLPPGRSLSDATNAINQTMQSLRMPSTIHGTFSGTAQAFQQSLSDEPLLIMAALAAIYIVLGILYESYIHPITIISTIPSAASARCWR